MRLLTTSMLLAICVTAIGQTFPEKKDKGQKSLTFYPRTYIDTETTSTDSTGIVVIIQNSLPKGGGRYTDSTGKSFGYLIFWTRIMNDSATPLELTINFPADSLAIHSSPNSYLKLFLPPDTMTLDKVSLYDYGITGLESFLNTGLNKPAMFKRTIKPKEECLFYTGMLLYEARGPVRTALVAKEQGLFYSINLLDFALIPCGGIVPTN